MTGSRLDGLDSAAAGYVVRAAQALALGRVGAAEAALAPALAAQPRHPEVLRLQAGILNLRGNFTAALASMECALAGRPSDALYHNTLATILGAAGNLDAAIRELRRACELQPRLASAWYNLGVLLMRCVRVEAAIDALRRAVELAPDNMDARALLGDALRIRGEVRAATAEYREVLHARPWTGMAWWGLADLRTETLDTDDIDRMRAALCTAPASDDDRIATGFALARALDERGRYEEALDALQRAHALARRRQHWDAAKFSRQARSVTAAFTPLPDGAPPGLGREVIFIVGMPRSGTTLVEQILASHSKVEGSGELPDLPQVFAEETRRRGQPFPHWVSGATPDDWRRLGERYLALTTRWRTRKPWFTDKLPNNWMYIGAIRTMLPAARVVVCRRDPLETCFSCYRQHLFNNEYARTPGDLAAFWRDFDRTAGYWASRCPTHVYEHAHATLQRDPESSIRSLLTFCGLGFEECCVRFQDTRRDVRSPSATQVRRPLQRDTAHARRYGNLLDPLRAALGLPPFEA